MFDELNSRLHVQYVYIRLHVRLVITLHTFTFYYSWRCKRLSTNSNFVELELFPNEISFLVDTFFVYVNVIDIYLYRLYGLMEYGLILTLKKDGHSQIHVVYLLTRLIGTRLNLQKRT